MATDQRISLRARSLLSRSQRVRAQICRVCVLQSAAPRQRVWRSSEVKICAARLEDPQREVVGARAPGREYLNRSREHIHELPGSAQAIPGGGRLQTAVEQGW